MQAEAGEGVVGALVAVSDGGGREEVAVGALAAAVVVAGRRNHALRAGGS